MGHPFFNECVFVVDTRDEGGAPTRTLLTADVFWNYPAHGQPGESLMSARDRLWRAGMNRLYGLFYRQWMRTGKCSQCVYCFQPHMTPHLLFSSFVSPLFHTSCSPSLVSVLFFPHSNGRWVVGRFDQFDADRHVRSVSKREFRATLGQLVVWFLV